MDTINRIENWFAVGVPEPTHRNIVTQLAADTEECSELFAAMSTDGTYPDISSQLDEVSKWLYSRDDIEPHEIEDIDQLATLDAICDKIVTAVGLAKMLGFDISGALKEVAQSNESKYYYAGVGDLSDHEYQDLHAICKEIESQGRYKGVGWEHHGEWIVFKDEAGKIMKNPRTYREPELASFIGGE